MTALPLVVAVTGASGAPYAVRLLEALAAAERDARRLQLERLGIAVATSNDLEALPLAIEEVERCRRRSRHVRA